jgi:atypical dual specificity phosphatase
MALPRNFTFIIENQLAGCGAPVSEEQVLCMKESANIQAIVSLTETALDPEWIQRTGMDYIHLPIHDFEAPSPKQIDDMVVFVEKQIKKASPIAIHCRAGIGRTGK